MNDLKDGWYITKSGHVIRMTKLEFGVYTSTHLYHYSLEGKCVEDSDEDIVESVFLSEKMLQAYYNGMIVVPGYWIDIDFRNEVAAITKVSSLRLEVGKTYKDRKGKVVKILKWDISTFTNYSPKPFPFYGDNGWCYRVEGWGANYSDCDFDLIEELQ